MYDVVRITVVQDTERTPQHEMNLSAHKVCPSCCMVSMLWWIIAGNLLSRTEGRQKYQTAFLCKCKRIRSLTDNSKSSIVWEVTEAFCNRSYKDKSFFFLLFLHSSMNLWNDYEIVHFRHYELFITSIHQF
jgi:hypothetical protein